MPSFAFETCVLMLFDLFLVLVARFFPCVSFARGRAPDSRALFILIFAFFEIVHGSIRPTAIYVVYRSVSVVDISWPPFGSWSAAPTAIQLGTGCAVAIVLSLRLVSPLLLVFSLWVRGLAASLPALCYSHFVRFGRF